MNFYIPIAKIKLAVFAAILLLLCQSSDITAQDENNVVQVGGGPWHTNKTVKLPAQRFDINYARGQFYFSGYIQMEPTVTFNAGPDRTTFSVDLNVSAKVTDENPLPNTYFWLGYRLARQVMDYPDQSVRSIKVHFNQGDSVIYAGWNTEIPKGAEEISRIEVTWYSSDVEMERKLIWGGIGFPWLKAAAAGAGAAAALTGVGGILLYRRRLRRQRDEREEDRNDTWEIRFLGIDPEWEPGELQSGQIIHIRIKSVAEAGTDGPPQAVTVGNLSRGTAVSLSLTQDAEAPGTFLSEPLILQWPEETLRISDKKLKAGPGDWLCASLENDRTSMMVAQGLEEIIPHLPGFRLERKGDGRRLLINPDLKRDGSLVVRLVNPDGEGVAGERIQWRIDRLSEAVITATDDYGETALSFAPMRDGRFAAMFDGLLLAEGIPAGDIEVTAVPADASFIGLLETKPARFSARLTPPTLVDVLGANFAPVPCLIDRQEYYLRTLIGGGGRGRLLRPKNVTGTLTLPDGDSEEVTLEKTNHRWLYDTNEPGEVRVNENGDELVFTCCNNEIRTPVYETDVIAQWHELGKVLDGLKKLIDDALQGELDEQSRAQLEIKAGLAKNALIWHAYDFGYKPVNIGIADKYRELLLDEDADYGNRINSLPDQRVLPDVAKNIQLHYVCKKEQAVIDPTVDEVVKRTRGIITPTDAMFILLLETVRFVLSPHIGAYVLITGRTEEGRRASTVERILGGIDVLLTLVPVGIAASRYARAARAMRTQARAELRLMNKTLGQAYDSGIFTLAEVSAKQLEQRFRHLFRKSVKQSDRLLARIEAMDNRLTTLRSKVADHRNELEKAEDLLRQMEHERTLPPVERTPGIRTTPSAIAAKKRAIQQRRDWLNKAVDELDSALAKQRELADALDAIGAGRYLDRQELLRMHEAGVLPAAHDRFDGIPAWQLFEKQAEGAFAATDPLWAGNNKVFIREPYRRTNWGTRFSINEKVKTRHPEPDHLRIDSDSVAAGDSKFYFWPEGESLAALFRSERRLVDGHVITIVDTIEKARLSQFHILQGTAGMSGAPASRVWREVFDLPMVIVTPTDVPGFVQQMIKSRVRGAGRNVVFKTMKPRLDLWAEMVPGTGKGH